MNLPAASGSDRWRNHPVFATHAPGWDAAASAIHYKTMRHGEAVIHHGDAAQSLWLVYRGWVKLTRQTPDGKETVIGLCSEGDVFGEAALFAHASYPYHAEVIGHDAELAALPGAFVRDLMAKTPAVSAHIMALLNDRVSQAQLKLEHLSTLSAAQRLGCFLLRLCHAQVNGGKTLEIPVEKNILAAYLGMKPETLSRSQQQLKPLGITVHGAQITIDDVSRLREFVCTSCSESGNCDVEAALD